MLNRWRLRSQKPPPRRMMSILSAPSLSKLRLSTFQANLWRPKSTASTPLTTNLSSPCWPMPTEPGSRNYSSTPNSTSRRSTLATRPLSNISCRLRDSCDQSWSHSNALTLMFLGLNSKGLVFEKFKKLSLHCISVHSFFLSDSNILEFAQTIHDK